MYSGSDRRSNQRHLGYCPDALDRSANMTILGAKTVVQVGPYAWVASMTPTESPAQPSNETG